MVEVVCFVHKKNIGIDIFGQSSCELASQLLVFFFGFFVYTKEYCKKNPPQRRPLGLDRKLATVTTNVA